MVGSFVGLWVFEAMGFSGQSQILYGFPLIGILLVGLVVTMLATGVLGVAIERVALRPLRGVSGTAPSLSTTRIPCPRSAGTSATPRSGCARCCSGWCRCC